VDDLPSCWAIVCFYVERGERRGGVAAGRRHANEMFVGSVPMFRRAGFEEVGRRSPTRPIVRRVLSGRGGPGGRGGSR